MLTTRDLEVADFISEFKIARTSTIQELFYPSLRVTQRRLEALCQERELHRYRDSISSEYLYYKTRPKQLKHSLLVTDFYRELNKITKIHKFVTEVNCGSIRPDAIIGYETSKKHIATLEIELSNKGFDVYKYEAFYSSGEYKTYFPVLPLIIAVTDKPVPSSVLKILVVKTDLSDIKKLGRD
jgi:hypothetical protein